MNVLSLLGEEYIRMPCQGHVCSAASQTVHIQESCPEGETVDYENICAAER